MFAVIPEFPADTKIATRKAGSDVLQPLAKAMPLLVGGSADLYGSTLNYIGDVKAPDDFKPGHRQGRNIRFGIREHGMCAIMNGIAAHGIFRPSGATFLVFADYCRPSIRLAALSHLPVIYIFTHDSIGVGEDGPTHQPIETIPGLRIIPNLDVIRPGDPEETAGAFVAALERTDGPTLLALSRQAIPLMSPVPVKERREGVLKGGYIAKKETGKLDLILLSAGSELQHAMKAAESLGEGTRVVSMPCFVRFDRQSAAYREEVLPQELPPPCRHRVRRDGDLGALRRVGWRDHRHRPLRHLRAWQRGDEGAGHHGRARRRGGEGAAGVERLVSLFGGFGPRFSDRPGGNAGHAGRWARVPPAVSAAVCCRRGGYAG